ncbi:MAG: hypothetical protein GX552_01865 [Chloroflexi bacterium]|nr:hypothetical protein [Chloroflexota bacterium]
MSIRSFKQLEYEATWVGPKKVAIAAAANAETLTAARDAQSSGLAHCILVDDRPTLLKAADAADRHQRYDHRACGGT